MKKTIKLILDLAIILIIIVIFLNFYFIIKSKLIQKKPYVNYCGYTFFIIDSSSMYNTLEENDLVIVKITDNVNTNDIISFEQDNNIVTHRIIEINGDTIITKGDYNNYNDEPIKRDNIIGKVIKIKKRVGIFKKVFQYKRVTIPIVIEIIVLLILIFI